MWSVKTDLSLRWVHRWFRWFCHAAAQMMMFVIVFLQVGPQERYHVRLYGSVRDKKDFWIKKLQDSGINISRDRETVAGTGL